MSLSRIWTERLLLLIALSAWALEAVSGGTLQAKAAAHFNAVLDAAEAKRYESVIDELEDLGKLAAAADPFLLSSLDYYLGEGPSEIQTQLIVKRGKRVLGPIRQMLARPIRCRPEHAALCLDRTEEDVKARNARIQTIIDMIESRGKIRRQKEK